MVSWSVTYLKNGYEITVTLYGGDLVKVLAEGKALLEKMRQNGVAPVRTRPIPPRPHPGEGKCN